MSTECDIYLNTILLVIFLGAISLYIWMNYNYKHENMTVSNPNSDDPEYVIARVHHNDDKDTFYAFPYSERTYRILKNIEQRFKN